LQEEDFSQEKDDAMRQQKAKDASKEYQRYLAEKRRALEKDPELRAQTIMALEKAQEEGGGIADEERVTLLIARAMAKREDSRTRLEEQQRAVVDRQRRTARRERMKESGADPRAGEFDFKDADRDVWMEEKVDHRKLVEIAKRRVGQAENLDRDRRRAFMQHEMKRLLTFRKKVEAESDPAKKQALIDAHEVETEAQQASGGGGEALKAPGSRAELEDVWEKDDGFDRKQFDPKTFFRMHDVNSDNVLDTKEMEAMFMKEATRMHRRRARKHQAKKGGETDEPAKAEEEDPFVVNEEVARMREHVMKNYDTDEDGMVSFEEWQSMTKNKEKFEKEEKWDPVKPESEITEKQLEQFKKLQAKIAATKHGEVDPKLLKAARRFKENLEGDKGAKARHDRKRKRRQELKKAGAEEGVGGMGMGHRGSGMGELSDKQKKRLQEVAAKMVAAKQAKGREKAPAIDE
jgi:hypothetical protein